MKETKYKIVCVSVSNREEYGDEDIFYLRPEASEARLSTGSSVVSFNDKKYQILSTGIGFGVCLVIRVRDESGQVLSLYTETPMKPDVSPEKISAIAENKIRTSSLRRFQIARVIMNSKMI